MYGGITDLRFEVGLGPVQDLPVALRDIAVNILGLDLDPGRVIGESPIVDLIPGPEVGHSLHISDELTDQEVFLLCLTESVTKVTG